jgi:hypothetical protein
MYALNNGAISRAELSLAYYRGFQVMLEKFSARYAELRCVQPVRNLVRRLEQKIETSRLALLRGVTSLAFLRHRKTDSIRSYGFHRI